MKKYLTVSSRTNWLVNIDRRTWKYCIKGKRELCLRAIDNETILKITRLVLQNRSYILLHSQSKFMLQILSLTKNRPAAAATAKIPSYTSCLAAQVGIAAVTRCRCRTRLCWSASWCLHCGRWAQSPLRPGSQTRSWRWWTLGTQAALRSRLRSSSLGCSSTWRSRSTWALRREDAGCSCRWRCALSCHHTPSRRSADFVRAHAWDRNIETITRLSYKTTST